MATTTRDADRTYTAADWEDYVHTGPETLAGRYMRRFWQPVYRSVDLAPGRAKPIRILNEDFTLYRGERREAGGESGAVHLVGFRCAHRGTQLSSGWVEGENLRCFYHGWLYGPDGQCVEQPAEPEPFCQKIRIKSYPVREYLGLIFAYLGEGDAPDFPRYPEFEGAGTLRIMAYVRECNYFNNIENGIDPAHLAFTHRGTLGGSDSLETSRTVRCEETEFGLLASRGGGDRPVRFEECVMPNVLLRLNVRPRWHALAWRVPIDDECHASFNLDFDGTKPGPDGELVVINEPERTATPQVAGAVLAGELTMADVADRHDLVNIQDSVAQVGQGAIANRQIERLGHSDVAIITLRKIWVRELRALAEGRPVKQWTRPAVAAVKG